MKKLISAILILCMACMLLPATAEEDISGDWYLNSVVADGISVNVAGTMAMTFHLNADGTAGFEMDLMGEKSEAAGTWTRDGSAVTVTTEDGNPMSLTYADGQLIIDMDGRQGIMTREAPVAVEKPNVIAAASEEDFFGNWTLAAMDMMGMYLSVDEMTGYSGTITIEAGRFYSDLQMGEGQEADKSEAETKFEDGKLTVSMEIPEEQAELLKQMGMELGSMTGTIELLDNGWILYSMELMGMQMGIYMAPADAAAEQPAA